MSGSMTRRQFVGGSAAVAAAIAMPRVASSGVLGANAEIRMAVIGCGVRGGVHVAEFGKQKGVRIVAVCDPDRTRSAAFAKLDREELRLQARRGRRRPQADGSQGPGRRVGGDDAVLARAADDLGLPDGPARLRREAAGAFHLGRPADGQRRAEVRPPGADRHPEPLPAGLRGDGQVAQGGPLGQDPIRHLLRQQAAAVDRQAQRAAAHPRDARLRALVRPGAEGAHLPRQTPVRLQLHVEHGRRRVVQPGRTRGGHRPLDPRLHGPAAADDEHRRPVRLRRRRRGAQHADHLLRLSRGADPLRGPQPAQEQGSA